METKPRMRNVGGVMVKNKEGQKEKRQKWKTQQNEHPRHTSSANIRLYWEISPSGGVYWVTTLELQNFGQLVKSKQSCMQVRQHKTEAKVLNSVN